MSFLSRSVLQSLSALCLFTYFLFSLQGCGPETSSAELAKEVNAAKQAARKTEYCPAIGLYEGELDLRKLGKVKAKLTVDMGITSVYDPNEQTYNFVYALQGSFNFKFRPDAPTNFNFIFQSADIKNIGGEKILSMSSSQPSSGQGSTGSTPNVYSFKGKVVGETIDGMLYTQIYSEELGSTFRGHFFGKRTIPYDCN